jgi:hypothetical protein
MASVGGTHASTAPTLHAIALSLPLPRVAPLRTRA